MASHGVPRVSSQEPKSAASLERESREIKEYQELVEVIDAKIEKKEFTPELLQKTADLLKKNPEYYTIWNHRRRIYTHEFESLDIAVKAGEITNENRCSQVLDIINMDLQFLFPLLVRYPKCYWIWNHRLWLLEQASLRLPTDTARSIWEDELGLVGKMLSRDSRNFLGWGYRRTVVASLESPALHGTSLSRKEFDYTTKMIGANLSNFSAWHNRTKLILKILEDENASDDARRIMFDEELTLIHNALFDPYDQSLWFYHNDLMCALDPSLSSRTMVPRLTTEEKLEYISKEIDFVQEVLEDAEDCKWAYQSLIECKLIEGKLRGELPASDGKAIREWLLKLKKLDPLRIGRWEDMEKSLL